MNLFLMYAYHSRELAWLLKVETWQIKMELVGIGQDVSRAMLESIDRAAQATTVSNRWYGECCMERVLLMAQRGDKVEQINAWVAALPNELTKQEYVESVCAVLDIQYPYPGGPGALYGKAR